MPRFLLLSTVLLFSGLIHAQIASIYVLSANPRFSNVQTGVLSTSSGLQQQYTTFWASGIGGGLTFNFIPVGPIKVGLDLRGSTRSGTAGADTAMGGIRVGINPPLMAIKPYIQASGGYVETRTVNISGGGTFTNRYAAWEVFGGVDYPLVPFLDFRVIEVGGGTGTKVNSSGRDISLFSIDTGLVLHF